MPPKILVIEDDEQIRNNIAILLRSNAFDPIEAADGEEGLRLVWEQQPDLIICDIMMPGLEGYEVLKILSQDSITSAIPFIFLTAKDKRSELRQGMELGSDDYITKPYNNSELLMAIHARLHKRQVMNGLIAARLAEITRQQAYSIPGYLLSPLSVLLGYSDLLANSTEPLEGNQIRQIGRDIQNSAQLIARVLENYRIYNELNLLLTDPDQLALMRRSQCLDAHNIIWELVAVKTLSTHRQDDVNVETESVNLLIQEGHFQWIVEELLDRALRYSLPHATIRVTGQKKGWDYHILISFQGRPAMNRTDFEPATDPGLAVLHQFMELYRGRFAIAAIEDQTQFLISLPMQLLPGNPP